MAKPVEWADFTASVAKFIGTDAAGLSMNTSLFEDLGIDSLGLFGLGLFLIKTHGGRIPINSVASIQTLGDIFTLLCNSPDSGTSVEAP